MIYQARQGDGFNLVDCEAAFLLVNHAIGNNKPEAILHDSLTL